LIRPNYGISVTSPQKGSIPKGFDFKQKHESVQDRGPHDYMPADLHVPPFSQVGGVGQPDGENKKKLGDTIKGLKDKIQSIVTNTQTALGKRSVFSKEDEAVSKDRADEGGSSEYLKRRDLKSQQKFELAENLNKPPRLDQL
jgi:hypothetical protein